MKKTIKYIMLIVIFLSCVMANYAQASDGKWVEKSDKTKVIFNEFYVPVAIVDANGNIKKIDPKYDAEEYAVIAPAAGAAKGKAIQVTPSEIITDYNME